MAAASNTFGTNLGHCSDYKQVIVTEMETKGISKTVLSLISIDLNYIEYAAKAWTSQISASWKGASMHNKSLQQQKSKDRYHEQPFTRPMQLLCIGALFLLPCPLAVAILLEIVLISTRFTISAPLWFYSTCFMQVYSASKSKMGIKRIADISHPSQRRKKVIPLSGVRHFEKQIFTCEAQLSFMPMHQEKFSY